jgi:uncharacterized protein YndB with AHSA1/START domain
MKHPESPRVSAAPEVRVSRTVAAPLARVFEAFTAEMDAWWPRDHRLGAAERRDVVVEPHEGGRWFERGIDGSTCDWGRVLQWDPPHHVVLSWMIGLGFVPGTDPERASRVDVRFEEAGPDATTITIAHSAFEAHGDGWQSMRDAVAGPGGWPDIARALARLAERPGAASGEVTAPGTIRFERLLPAPVERVWSFLVESDDRGRWLASGEMDLREGAPFTLYFFHDALSPLKEPLPEQYRAFEGGCTLECRITHADPPRRLSYTWGGESEVTFELSPAGERTRLVLTHRRLDDANLVSVASGWHTHLAIMEARLAGIDPTPFWSAHARHEAVYRVRLAGV